MEQLTLSVLQPAQPVHFSWDCECWRCLRFAKTLPRPSGIFFVYHGNKILERHVNEGVADARAAALGTIHLGKFPDAQIIPRVRFRENRECGCDSHSLAEVE